MAISAKSRRELALAIGLVVPAIIILLGMILFPVGYNFFLSFFEKHMFVPQAKFVGIDNYLYLITRDREFLNALINGFIYAFGSIALQLGLGLGAALLLAQRFKGRSFFMALFFFPYMIPTIIVVILWKWLLDASHGYVNYLLTSCNIIHSPVVWLSEKYILLVLIFVSVWQFTPFVFFTLLVKLETIPKELYEAAMVDGASAFQRFTRITLPQIKYILIVIVLLRSLWMFTKFDVVWLLAGSGGILRYGETLPVYAYRKTFEYLELGMGTAISVIMFLILVIVAVISLRLLRHA
ncbi:MAG TPA: sugar ABC transporter permease [archaeon]|nr:sugar ABC transporter permease [archaeon]